MLSGAPPVIARIVAQHAEDAAFLWILRDRAACAPHCLPVEFDRLDERIEAHVDGLRVAGQAGWEIALAAFERDPEPGEAFVAMVLALESRAHERLEQVIAMAQSQDLARPLISALGWVEPGHLRGLVGPLLADPRPFRRMLGVAACSVHRVEPGTLLPGLLEDPVPMVRARALRLAGELGRADLRAPLVAALADPDPEVRARAATAALFLGERREAVGVLQALAGSAGPGWRALRLVLRVLEPGAAQVWLGSLGKGPDAERMRVAGAGILGDPALVAWLIWQMRRPDLARLAGEAFTTITGADLAAEGLASPPPEDMGDDLGTPARQWDEDLPYPDPPRVERWWAEHRGGLAPGVRYVLGRPLDRAVLADILARGRQRQRAEAALDLALLDSRAGIEAKRGLVNVAARSRRRRLVAP